MNNAVSRVAAMLGTAGAAGAFAAGAGPATFYAAAGLALIGGAVAWASGGGSGRARPAE